MFWRYKAHMSSKHAQSKIRDKSSTYITDKFAINYMLGCYYMSRYLYKRLFYVFAIMRLFQVWPNY